MRSESTSPESTSPESKSTESAAPASTALAELQEDAKRLYREVYARDASALAVVEQHHPDARAALAALAAFALRDAQLALARSRGFASWTKLRAHLRGDG